MVSYRKGKYFVLEPFWATLVKLKCRGFFEKGRAVCITNWLLRGLLLEMV